MCSFDLVVCDTLLVDVAVGLIVTCCCLVCCGWVVWLGEGLVAGSCWGFVVDSGFVLALWWVVLLVCYLMVVVLVCYSGWWLVRCDGLFCLVGVRFVFSQLLW